METNKKTFTVSLPVDTVFNYQVEANSIEEAKEIVLEMYKDGLNGEPEYNFDTKIDIYDLYVEGEDDDEEDDYDEDDEEDL